MKRNLIIAFILGFILVTGLAYALSVRIPKPQVVIFKTSTTTEKNILIGMVGKTWRVYPPLPGSTGASQEFRLERVQ